MATEVQKILQANREGVKLGLQQGADIMQLEHLKSILSYDPTTGIFTWLTGHRKGRSAGSLQSKNYIQIYIDRKAHYAHRLAWFYVYGEWPSQQIDHINRCPCDNRIENLRHVTRSQNQQNTATYRSNTSGFRGVYWNKNIQKWQARIKVNSKRKHLGSFDSKESAYAAYLQGASELHTHNPYVLKESQQ